jgi:hypothetical protein
MAKNVSATWTGVAGGGRHTQNRNVGLIRRGGVRRVTRGKPPASEGVVRVGEREGSAREGEETTLSGRSQPMD